MGTMTSRELFNKFCELSEEEQDAFLRTIAMHLDLYLPDGKYIMLTVEDYARLRRGARAEDKLYDVARQVTLEAGLPWTDPRTGETFKP